MKRAGLLSLAMMSLAGCIAQADYDQLKVQNASLAAEKEAFAQRALDAEAQADAMRNQVRMKENELEMQKALAANLKQEAERLAAAFQRAQEILGKVDLNPAKPLIIDRVLPQELDAALKNFASAHPGMIDYDPTRGVVKWKSDLLFPSGSDVVREDAKSTLRSFTEIINTPAAAQFDILVIGHTDNDPIVHARTKGHPTNWHLSVHRSISVGGELLDAQLDPERLGVMGYGEYRPIASNATTDGKEKNRRVEIYIVSRGNLVSSDGMETTPDAQNTTAPATTPDMNEVESEESQK